MRAMLALGLMVAVAAAGVILLFIPLPGTPYPTFLHSVPKYVLLVVWVVGIWGVGEVVRRA